MDYEQIEIDDRDGVPLITLNRPERLNAWTRLMSRELSAAIVDGNEQAAIGAFVFTGAGRAFCAGADIGDEFASRPADGAGQAGGADQPEGGQPEAERPDWVSLVRESKPMVAAINGPAVGVGLTLLLPMDRLLAGRSARLSARFVKMGLVPELASSQFLVQRCGWGAASDLALSGRLVGAEDAARIGLVDEVVDDDALLSTALAVAAEYAANPPWAVRRIKQLLTVNGAEADLRTVQQREHEALEQAFTTPDHAEAVAAFLEKREPRFR